MVTPEKFVRQLCQIQTQKELAAQLQVARSVISRIVTGKRRASKILVNRIVRKYATEAVLHNGRLMLRLVAIAAVLLLTGCAQQLPKWYGL